MKITNGRLITPEGITGPGTVVVGGGRIVTAGEGNIPCENAVEIDAQGQYVSPGFIDLHVHGGGGADFMDSDVESFLEVARTHARYGTTSLMPTTLTSDAEDLNRTFEVYVAAAARNTDGADFLGLHLEGPYFAMSQRGAQDPRYIRDPDPDEYEAILDSYAPLIARWSAAPELPGSARFAKRLKHYGVLPSIAHTDAVYEDAVEAFASGFTLVTHLYSGMQGVTRRNAYRYAGMVESAYLIENMDVEIIADGVHLPAPLLKLVYKIKGSEHIALVTDAMRGAGMPEGESILGGKRNGLKVIVEDGVAKLPDRTSFAGSVATADRLVRSMIDLAGVPLWEAVRMLTATPARIASVDDRKGSLTAGLDADIVIFDDRINIDKTIVKGRIVYEKPSIPLA